MKMADTPDYPRTRQDALTLAYRLIEVAPGWDAKLLPQLRTHFHNLTGKWRMSGLLTEEDAASFHVALDAALEKAKRDRQKPPWWDIAARIGL